jgi:hypothetical protein
MKLTKTLTLTAVLLACSAVNSHAWFKVGHVMCDANTNGIIDRSDSPVPSVLVVVTNASGTVSNVSWTAADGFFIVQLPAIPDVYFDYIHPATLPLGTTAVIPAVASFTNSATTDIVTNDFLIENPACLAGPGPGPGPGATNACWLTGGGTIRFGKGGKPAFSFGGNVFPGCNSTSGDGGNWNVVAHIQKLHFEGTVIQIVNCGNVVGAPPGSTSPVTPFNFIEFQGVGKLTTIGKRKTNLGVVNFFARAEDLGEPGKKDRLYLRVTSSTGQTLLLISAQPGNPDVVAPQVIASGNLQLHVSSCDNPPQ